VSLQNPSWPSLEDIPTNFCPVFRLGIMYHGIAEFRRETRSPLSEVMFVDEVREDWLDRSDEDVNSARC
jgi:hypothetical protein